ncbi:Arm DNA-binding domain-containing protein [Palleronia sediminis]|uniref:Arm DNA-binding domain-containing protein n=1 Tax=Palleronia sediminis TaxID=2547833 RepID=UPI00197CED9B|nr:Arm DNA-binding domain-containing protein [Palleronia sediminis]
MAKITKRTVNGAGPQTKDYIIWDDELPGFELRVFPSSERSNVIQYRARGRSRRYAIGLHRVWTPEIARREAKVRLGDVTQGNDPAAEREEERRAVTVRELCEQYIADMEAGLVLGEGWSPQEGDDGCDRCQPHPAVLHEAPYGRTAPYPI